MDCFSVESEFIESLDFLSPPVKRLQNSREAFGSAFYNEPSNVHLLRGLRNKFARRSPDHQICSPKLSSVPSKGPSKGPSKRPSKVASKVPSKVPSKIIKPNAGSSTSLILKKTSERQLLEQYSVVSYTSLTHSKDEVNKLFKPDLRQNTAEKPLIKVTVIPRTDHIQTAKILRKRRFIPKRVQSTTSNQENSVQTKNVYLIVAGRRKEKIYEIKTTGSAKFSSDHDSHAKDDELPIRELSNIKHLIDSLNMDKKKKKGKKGVSDNYDEPQQTSVEWKGYPECENCFCAQTMPEDTDPAKKSRIKIFGQFGISEDDKYVLRYGATVNDKQVLSDVAQLTRDFSPVPPFEPYAKYTSSYEDDPMRPKEFGIQADCDNDLYFEVATKDTVPSKESQGTQVNFNVKVATVKEKFSRFSDKKIQCTCCATSAGTNRSEQKMLKDCQSPLVIISVYPKQTPEDFEESVHTPKDGRGSSPPRMHTYTSNQIIKTEKSTKRTATETKKAKPAPRSRSPSPVRKPSRGKMLEDRIIESRLNKAHAKDRRQHSSERSPDRHKALKAIKDKIQEKDKLKHDAGTRKPSKLIASNATQAAINAQVVVSNATQVSNKNRIASNATQVSARNRSNYTVSNATQVKSPPNIALVKHTNTQNVVTQSNQPQISVLSNATQATRSAKRFVATNSTQISKNEYFTANNGTQVPKIQQKQQTFNPTRKSKNQETFTAPATVFKSEQTSRIIQPLQERGTNTEHARAKKALVETYTKKLTEQMDQSLPARFDSSKITINIDGDKEYYDVLFNQDKLSTDLTIRKTVKDMGSQKGIEEEPSVSLDNLLYSDDVKDCMIAGNKSPTKSLSIALYNNQSDDESPLTKHVSRLTIRDSLEISHRREDRSVHNNIKNTQTCFTAQLTETIPDETEFLAPIKHYTGDDCSICDPIERDKQIRELLGVEKSKFSSSKTLQGYNSTIDEHYPFHCIYRQECKKSQVTEINFGFQKLFCPCFKPPKGKHLQTVAVQCQRHYSHKDSNRHDTYCSISGNNKVQQKNKKKQPKNKNQSHSDHECCIADSCPNYDMYDNDDGEDNVHVKYDYPHANEGKEIKIDSKDRSSVFQQLVLNRNIQVFLQVEQFSKQKPIVLSRKQYDKVKKTIQKTICKEKKSSHDKRKRICHKCNTSEVSVGEVRTKNERRFQQVNRHINQGAQTDQNIIPCDKETCRKDRKKSLQKIKAYKRKLARRNSPDLSEDLSEDILSDRQRKKERSKNRSQKKKLAAEQVNEPAPAKPPDQKLELINLDSNYTPTHSNHSKKSKKRHGTKHEDYPKHDNVASPHKHEEPMRPLLSPVSPISPISPISPVSPVSPVSPLSARTSEECVCCTPDRCDEVKYDQISDWKRELSPEHKRDHSPDRYKEREKELEIEHRTEHYEDDEKCCHQAEIKTLILFNANDDTKVDSINCKKTGIDTPPRKTMSSVEVRYASVAYMKQVAYSSTDMGVLSNSSLPHINSFQTIFRGHRKSHTPNLGTSAYSLYSEDGLQSENKSAKFIMEPRDSKPKKPFLRRLMSCLVMRSTRESELKIPIGPAPDPPSVNSSIDSYHISTSFGAVEVSSSIYDTSASFYSNHTILPVNSKIKRGFFSSVRGFLTNRKS